MNSKEYSKLSKEISYALRHAPWEFELELDDLGFTPIESLLQSLRKIDGWKDIEQEDIEKMIFNSQKKRHEIIDGKVRAFYGHSIPNAIKREEVEPPTYLYHGTSPEFIDDIRKNGLLSKARQYVHLSEDTNTADIVGKRKNSSPVILKIDTKKAEEQGSKFYFGNERVWLSDIIPSSCILFMDQYLNGE
ncbi:RNA 2'-phosphotransferase [Paenilisteria newyorkensis]|uniref:RNA 2'-phosphotransferase n=1 Tax=Listeria newyorkensis TaxID=1497681 RepID=UPI000669B96E|nr:RNA 2'-phosphotransferase [Listeria newyorkensis]KMT61625.1 RNA 2'-phosphotransferase [Listeria newyorkensis]